MAEVLSPVQGGLRILRTGSENKNGCSEQTCWGKSEVTIGQFGAKQSDIGQDQPLEVLSADQIFERYCFLPDTIVSIIRQLERVKDSLRCVTHRWKSLPPVLRVLVALNFYAIGTFQITLGDTVRIHKSTVSRFIRQVTQGLIRLSTEGVKFGGCEEDLKKTKQEFYDLQGTVFCRHY